MEPLTLNLNPDPQILGGLDLALFQDPAWGPKAYGQALSHSLWGAFSLEREGQTQGWLLFRLVAGECEILRLGVVAAARRQGVATRLLEQLALHCRQHEGQRIYLEVRASNQAARQLYAANGYRQTGLRENYYRQPPEEALLLELRLDEAPANPHKNAAQGPLSG